LKTIGTAFCLVLTMILAGALAFAGAARDEFTFSAELFNPNTGDTVWSATGEYLIGLGNTGAFRMGPSISMFDLGSEGGDGQSYGLAVEFGFPKSGLFVGAGGHWWSGNAADLADKSADLRAGVKIGQERWFAKLFASQVWAEQADGSRIDPDGMSAQAGLGVRF
jgi:hypothetical protein